MDVSVDVMRIARSVWQADPARASMDKLPAKIKYADAKLAGIEISATQNAAANSS